jgi:hypothetical protein
MVNPVSMTRYNREAETDKGAFCGGARRVAGQLCRTWGPL